MSFGEIHIHFDQKSSQMVYARLYRSMRFELARRNSLTGIIHPVSFFIAINLSPFRITTPELCHAFFWAFIVAVLLRFMISRPKAQKKYVARSWVLNFTLLTAWIFALWSAWLCIHFVTFGLSQETYFICLMLAGLCTGGLMGFASSFPLMLTVILITLIPPTIVLCTFKTHEANSLALLFLMYMTYLIALARRVNSHFRSSVLNKELAEQNKSIIESVLESVPGIVCSVDHEMNFIWMNKKMYEHAARNSKKLDDSFKELVQSFIHSGKKADQFEYLVDFSNGPRWMMIFLSRYTEYQEGRVLIVAYDIQSMKVAEEELEKQRAISIESAKLATLGEMSAGIAHEINNPLAVMIGRADLMINDLKEGQLSKDHLIFNLEKIVKSSERIAKIVKGLKAFSRNGDQDEFEKCKVDSMVQDVLNFSHERFKHDNVELKVDIDPELSVECRSTQIEQVILNLLSNAFDAVQDMPDSWIRVEGKRDGRYAVISIIDSGDGVPSQLISKIMQPFFTTKEVGKGTGLGLSISLGIVKAHHGELYYDTSSKHTKFVIRIPRAQIMAMA